MNKKQSAGRVPADEINSFNFTNGLTDVAGLISVKDLAQMDDCQTEVDEIIDYLKNGLNILDTTFARKSEKVERVVYLDSRNNGLSDDWDTNGHSSPFRIFYSKTMGAVRETTAVMCYLYSNGLIRGWYFSDDDPNQEHELPDGQFKGNAIDFIEHKVLGANRS